MDKKTRVLNAFDKKPVDHVPVGFWIHYFEKMNDEEAMLQAHYDYHSALDFDIAKLMSDGFFAFPLDGLEVKTADDLLKIRQIGPDHPWIRGQIARVKAIRARLGEDKFYSFNLFTPFTSLMLSVSDELIMRFARENKNELMHALDIVALGGALLGELLITQAGCDGVYFAVQSGELTRFTEAEYKDIVCPSELYVLEHVNRYSDYNILHCCGFYGNKNRISLWKDYPAKCVNWATAVEELPLHEGRYFFGNKAVMGGFDTHWGMDSTQEQRGILYHGSKEELQNYTRELVVNTGKLGTVIGGDCTVDHRIDINRLRWIVEAVRSV
jgi:uroporphyrinogen decarboxylase